jgi:hypothetical protein
MNIRLNVLKDKLRRFHFHKRERRLMVLKWSLSAIHNKYFGVEFAIDQPSLVIMNKYIYKSIVISTKANNSVTRIRNRCRVSNRARGSDRVFRMFHSSILEEFKVTQRFVGLSRGLFEKPKRFQK